MRELIFRGYDVVEHPDGRCEISKDSKLVCSQPTIELARQWINEQRKRDRRRSRGGINQ
jgi:hypothetical protein